MVALFVFRKESQEEHDSRSASEPKTFEENPVPVNTESIIFFLWGGITVKYKED